MSITIKEIAELAGVHRSTVDKVIHHRKGVSDEVRAKIQNIIKENDYRPNVLGRILQKQGRRTVIRVIMAEVEAYQTIQQGIQQGMDIFEDYNIDFSFQYCKYQKPEKQAAYIQKAMEDEVDGILLLPISAPVVQNAAQEAIDQGIHVILVNIGMELNGALDFIGQDLRKAGRIAGRLMAEAIGEEGNIVVFASEENKASTMRCDYFRQLLEERYPQCHISQIIPIREEKGESEGVIRNYWNYKEQIKGVYLTCGNACEITRLLKADERTAEIQIIAHENYADLLEELRRGNLYATITSDLKMQGFYAIRILLYKIFYGVRSDEGELNLNILIRESVEQIG